MVLSFYVEQNSFVLFECVLETCVQHLEDLPRVITQLVEPKGTQGNRIKMKRKEIGGSRHFCPKTLLTQLGTSSISSAKTTLSQTLHPLKDLIKPYHDQPVPSPNPNYIASFEFTKFESTNRTSLDHFHFVHQSGSPWHQKDTTRLPSLYPETTPKIRSIGHVGVHASIQSNISPAPEER